MNPSDAGLVNVVVFPCPRAESLWSGAGPSSGCLHTTVCDTTLDGLQPRAYWRKQVYRRMWGWGTGCQQNLHRSAVGEDLEPRPGWRGLSAGECWDWAHWWLQLSVYLGWGSKKGRGTCQLFCSWRSILRISVPPAQALRLVNRSPSCLHQAFFNLLLLCYISAC